MPSADLLIPGLCAVSPRGLLSSSNKEKEIPNAREIFEHVKNDCLACAIP